MSSLTASTISPLSGDPTRQAIDSLRGYDYQIWCSVEAWLRLYKGQTLFLECAEDFDVVSEFEAQAVQVKNSPQDISLGSSDVRTAIENYWLLRTRNRDRSEVSMRFLTRGSVCFEKSRPFGKAKGIELWRRAGESDDAAAISIGKFLAGTFKNYELNDFLANASAAELRDVLFRQIEWVTDEPNNEAVKLSVERMAIQLGAANGITASASASAVDGFLAMCRETACKSSPEMRSLTLEDKLLMFEKKTSVRVPISSALLAQLGNTSLAPSATTKPQETLPVLPIQEENEFSDYQCLHCNAMFADGQTVCTGCGGQILWGATTDERKMGMAAGAALGGFPVLWLYSKLGINLFTLNNGAMGAAPLFFVVAIAFGTGFFGVSLVEKYWHSKLPRIFVRRLV